MNICRPGNCICDAAEYAGDTNCMGEVEGVAIFSGPYVSVKRFYYFDTTLGVVISVEQDERLPDVSYFHDPDLTRPV